jgi:hypothetical protein
MSNDPRPIAKIFSGETSYRSTQYVTNQPVQQDDTRAELAALRAELESLKHRLQAV